MPAHWSKSMAKQGDWDVLPWMLPNSSVEVISAKFCGICDDVDIVFAISTFPPLSSSTICSTP
jgi:hypothetical protein